MESTVEWHYSIDKSVDVSKAVLLEESRYFAGVLNGQQDLKISTIHLEYPTVFEEHLLPILVNSGLQWSDMKVTCDTMTCQLMQMADFLAMENLVDELCRRLLSHISSTMTLKEFNPENIPKSQVKMLMLQKPGPKLFRLSLFLNWVHGCDANFKREMKTWFEKSMEKSWTSMISAEDLLISTWCKFVENNDHNLSSIFSPNEVMKIASSCRSNKRCDSGSKLSFYRYS